MICPVNSTHAVPRLCVAVHRWAAVDAAFTRSATQPDSRVPGEVCCLAAQELLRELQTEPVAVVTGSVRNSRSTRRELLEVHAATRAGLLLLTGNLWPSLTGWQPPTELLELVAGGHLLGEQGGLDAVEQSFQPPHQLGVDDT